MKKQIIVALALLVSSFSFSQKDELKDAEKAIKSGNYADAKSAIKSAEALIGSADEKTKAKFYFLKGQAFYANGTATNDDVNVAIESFDKVVEIEKKDGKSKYTDEVNETKQLMLNSILTKANKALEDKNYSASAIGFEKAYRMSPKDTLYLYVAASAAINAQDYKTSLKHYEELRSLGFTGQEMEYVATNKETNEVDVFDNKTMRDLSIKSGTHVAPKDKKSDSKAAEIIKNIALIYINNGENEKGLLAIKEARESNPDDLSLLLSEANVHLQMGNRDEFKKLIEVATLKDPKNPELQYNLGVVAAEAGDVESAKKYYEKAIALDPEYADAYNNMAVLSLQGEQAIIEEMNKLGTSAADNKKYDELREKRSQIYRDAIPYLETTLKFRPKNIEAAKTLMNIYSALGETAKFKEMKAKVDALQGE
ncbi:tetratricopeptide repeat protein [Subsaxibacter sp. CAU 1640]|uniref:tetratricopeptide repeat protein n=1 Tax=Subsaxibacter sp. CAU 1640 TaxID=2933271 RepID=UPI00200695C5|nr:tetratricopeptide repeat protein [Subsaxibacter sp. CAU 1640]MCK7590880.1 tetratricopeptide repeat protein [Subsaxibacter sp. CAU 1640]